MCRNMPFKIYTENKYMGTLSLAIVSISISITIGDGIETRSTNIYAILYRFYNKKAFSKFWRNGPKSIENEEI